MNCLMKKNYTDIQKSDIQRYLPFLIVIGSIFVYYCLLKLGVPQILSMFTLGIGFVSAIQIMLRHTDKTKIPYLLKLEAVLFYFPLTSFLTTLYLIFYLAITSGYTLLNALVMAGTMNSSTNTDLNSYLGDFMNVYVLIYMIGILLVILSYFIVKKKLIHHYSLVWRSSVDKQRKGNE